MSEFLFPPSRCTCPPKPCPECDQAGEKVIAHPRGRQPQTPEERLVAYQKKLAHERERRAEIAEALKHPMPGTDRVVLKAAQVEAGRQMRRAQNWLNDLARAGAAKERKG